MLQRGEIALVGDVSVSASVVTAIADASHLSARAAADAAIVDALFSQAGRNRGLDTDPKVQWASADALAGRDAERVGADARLAGPPSEDELATLSVIHAVVLRSTILSEEGGRTFAEQVERAVQGAVDAEGFEKRATAVPHPGARLVVERVEQFAADGRLPDGSPLDSGFVAASFALPTSGATSPIVETPFGWHVIRLLKRRPPDPASLDGARSRLSEAVVSLRARIHLADILRARRTTSAVEVSGSAETLMAGALARLP